MKMLFCALFVFLGMVLLSCSEPKPIDWGKIFPDKDEVAITDDIQPDDPADSEEVEVKDTDVSDEMSDDVQSDETVDKLTDENPDSLTETDTVDETTDVDQSESFDDDTVDNDPVDDVVVIPDATETDTIDNDTYQTDMDTEIPDVDVPPNTNYVLCTGQDYCYAGSSYMECPSIGDQFYGQDVQHAILGHCIPRSYTLGGTDPEKTVTDNVSGLIWQRTLPTTYSGCDTGFPVGSRCTWQQAIDYCDNLTYGNYSDWRLPSSKELVSLPDYGRINPTLDTSYFSNFSLPSYWSATASIKTANYAWRVYFDYGKLTTYDKPSGAFVRCVRGASLPTEDAFVESMISGDTIINDNNTGLVWTKEETAQSGSWEFALFYCETLVYGGVGDWRLPNIVELITLINNNKYAPASAFPGVDIANYVERFWSSSSNFDSPGSAWIVDLYEGETIVYVKTASTDIVCVR